jgi:hypothetical protein
VEVELVLAEPLKELVVVDKVERLPRVQSP